MYEHDTRALIRKKHAPDEQYILQINMSFLNYSWTIERCMNIHINNVCILCTVRNVVCTLCESLWPLVCWLVGWKTIKATFRAINGTKIK